MAYILITLKVMPKNPRVNLIELGKKIESEIEKFGGDLGKIEKEPIGFGLEALKISFGIDEDKGSTDLLEENIKKIKNVLSVNIIDVRRAVG